MKVKAGLVPCHNGKILTCLSSNPKFGGDKFALAKGNIDAGETVLEAAIREAEEELGLKKSNMLKDTLKLVATEKQVTSTSTYLLTIYSVEVVDPYDFHKPCWEISETKWMTPEEFMGIGRESHKVFVSKL